MAEIRIEKKTPIWPWIIGILVVGAILYFFVFADDTTDNRADTKTQTEKVKENTMEGSSMQIASANEIDSYNEYVSKNEMSEDHEYTSRALSKLIAATSATAMALNIDVDADLKKATDKANEITKDATASTHARSIKDAAHSISNALKSIQRKEFSSLDSKYKEVEESVAKIKTDIPALDQKDAVKGFLKKSGNLLTSIKNDYGKEK